MQLLGPERLELPRISMISEEESNAILDAQARLWAAMQGALPNKGAPKWSIFRGREIPSARKTYPEEGRDGNSPRRVSAWLGRTAGRNEVRLYTQIVAKGSITNVNAQGDEGIGWEELEPTVTQAETRNGTVRLPLEDGEGGTEMYTPLILARLVGPDVLLRHMGFAIATVGQIVAVQGGEVSLQGTREALTTAQTQQP